MVFILLCEILQIDASMPPKQRQSFNAVRRNLICSTAVLMGEDLPAKFIMLNVGKEISFDGLSF